MTLIISSCACALEGACPFTVEQSKALQQPSVLTWPLLGPHTTSSGPCFPLFPVGPPNLPATLSHRASSSFGAFALAVSLVHLCSQPSICPDAWLAPSTVFWSHVTSPVKLTYHPLQEFPNITHFLLPYFLIHP